MDIRTATRLYSVFCVMLDVSQPGHAIIGTRL